MYLTGDSNRVINSTPGKIVLPENMLQISDIQPQHLEQTSHWVVTPTIMFFYYVSLIWVD